MTIKTRITFKDFLKFNLKNSLPRIVIFILIVTILLCLNFYNADQYTQEMLRSASIWFLLFFAFIVIRSYFKLKKVFTSNKTIQEEIIYTFTDDKIETKGETFDVNFSWDKVFLVKENKEWFLIYQSNTIMNMIPKKFFSSQEIFELRKIIRNKKIKTKLKS